RDPQMIKWLETQQQEMLSLTLQLAAINSSSHNAPGLAAMRHAVRLAFAPLSKDSEEEVNDSVIFRKEGSPRVLLMGHLDTVFPKNWECRIEGERLYGPGVADMKGGLVVLLYALLALEREKLPLGWTVCLNCDEEIGSPHSRALFPKFAQEHAFALIFEPALEGGALASARKGSATYEIFAKGQASHAGRNLNEGRSAILALAELSLALEGIANIGTIEGGIAPNIVPQEAHATLNMRSFDEKALLKIPDLAQAIGERRGVTFTLEGGIARPPKPLDPKTQVLLEAFHALDAKILWRESGGVCDGNNLAALGLPTIDSLGVRGGGLHSSTEYLEIPSLVERAKLVALFLKKKVTF
ncbi:MAG: hydrolase, partial [Verrucomicrobia bacterium]|nr:hydrolase [Verrucomicrobiota bacterium]